MGTVISKEQQAIIQIVKKTKNKDIISAMYDLATIEKGRPCQYSDEEILQQIENSLENVKDGKVISLEELEKKYI
jgi:hypothetical protein